jgi:dTDP-4-dehydrorhamnose 3,5-epimerase
MKSIEGMHIVPLKKVLSERGHLMEVQRSDDLYFPGFGQAYITCTLPGIIKAWYRHHQQYDQIALIKGQLVLILFDSRQNSPTRDNLLEIVITEQSPLLVQIPPGIWHGFKALGSEAMYLLHLNSVAFEFEHTDEDRLPSDTRSIPYQW